MGGGEGMRGKEWGKGSTKIIRGGYLISYVICDELPSSVLKMICLLGRCMDHVRLFSSPLRADNESRLSRSATGREVVGTRLHARHRRALRGVRSAVAFPLLFALLLVPFLCTPFIARGESNLGTARMSGEFPVPPGLRGKVEFWKLIFTKYGEKQLVFHHRDYPEITYSVLDFRELSRSYGGKELIRRTNSAIDEETERIRETLVYLSEGNEARTPFQRRLERLFSHLPGRATKNYAAAAEERQIRNQRGVKERFRDGVVRSGRYMAAMERVFETAGLPPELTRLPLIESSFDYTAYSSVGAAGIWQFMRATGKKYMRIDSYIDERRDPIFATRAAAQYLSHAYGVLGSWPLAVTSYNHGVTGVLRAAKNVGSTDIVKLIEEHEADSWGFASKNFYAELVAAVEIERNASLYYPGIRKEPAWHFDEVRIGRPISFQEAVRFSGASTEDVEKLNRALLKPILGGRAKIPAGTVLNVPAGKGRQLLARIGSGQIVAFDRASNHPAAGSLAQTRSGKEPRIQTVMRESIEEPEVRDLAEGAESTEVTGDRPSAEPQTIGDRVAAKAPPPAGRSYSVAQGDTIFSISRRFNVKVSDIIAANSLSNASALKVGSKLILPGVEPGPDDAAVAVAEERAATKQEPPKTRYVVAKNDTLGGIAKRFGFTTAEILKVNKGLSAKRLKPGSTIVLPVRPEMPAVSTDAPNKAPRTPPAPAKRASAPRSYTVQSGDTLSSIAKKSGVPLKRLTALNPAGKKKLKPGMKLRLE